MISVKSFALNPLQENTYLLYNEQKEALMIDPGCFFPAERVMLQEFIAAEGLKPVQLLNTHCHLDHVFGNKWAYETYKLELHIHPLEEIVLTMAPSAGQLWGLPFDNYTGPLHFINDGDHITLGTDTLEVILAPGHSPGSVCFYHKAGNFIIGGDVLFYEGIGRSDLPGGDPDVLLASIRERLFTLPDETVVYSGHGPATTIGHEKRHNPYVG